MFFLQLLPPLCYFQLLLLHFLHFFFFSLYKLKFFILNLLANIELSSHFLFFPKCPNTYSSWPLCPLAVRPRFTQPSKMRKRVIARPEGSSVRLKCTASGNPRPDIVWLKDSRPLADESRGKKKRWTLSLKNLTPQHSGKYTCQVSNPAGEINATYKVEVIRESQRITVTCHCWRESMSPRGPAIWKRCIKEIALIRRSLF